MQAGPVSVGNQLRIPFETASRDERLEVRPEQAPGALRGGGEFRVRGVIRLRHIEHQTVRVRFIKGERDVGVAQRHPLVGGFSRERGRFETLRKAVERRGTHHRKDLVLVAKIPVGRHGAAAQFLGQFAHRDALRAARGERVLGDAAHGFAELLNVFVRECLWHAGWRRRSIVSIYCVNQPGTTKPTG